jgi:dolichol-phosphate mannosyltransferase
VVYGSRRLNKGNVSHSSILFFAGGILVTTVFNLLYGYRLTDEPTCYKAFKTDLLRGMNICSDGFEWEPEVTAKLALRKVPIQEVPISYFPRACGDGKKITWRDGVRAVWTLLKLRFAGY